MNSKSLVVAIKLYLKDKLFQSKVFSKMIKLLETKIQISIKKGFNIGFSWDKVFVNHDQIFLDYKSF